jgi:hypothetical protein
MDSACAPFYHGPGISCKREVHACLNSVISSLLDGDVKGRSSPASSYPPRTHAVIELVAGGLAICRGNQGRTNTTKRQDTKEPLPARVAAIGREPEEAFQENQSALLNAVPRDAFKVEIAASRAMGIPRKRERHAPGVESPVAGVASPGPQAGRGAQGIEHTVAMRAKTVRAPALRADHRIHSPPRCGASEYPKPFAGATVTIPEKAGTGVT